MVAKASRNNETLALVFGGHIAGSRAEVVRSSAVHRHGIDRSFGDALTADLSADGRWLIVSVNHCAGIGVRGGVLLWLLDTITQEETRSNAEIPDFMNMARLLSCGRRLAVGFASGLVQVRSIPGLEVIWARQWHVDQVRKIAGSPDGKLLMTLGKDQKLVLSDAETGDHRVSEALSFMPGDCEFTSEREIVLTGPGGVFSYRVHMGS